MEKKCLCCSEKSYSDCCQPYHAGKENPPNALALMRSRYAAYCLNLPDYIIETTHPQNPHYLDDHEKWRRDIGAFSRQTTFEKLEIVQFIHGDEAAYVIFVAHLKQNHRDATFCEKSRFEKKEGKWLYRSAEIS